MVFKKGQKAWNKGLECPQIARARIGIKRPNHSKKMKGENNPSKRIEVKEKLKTNHWTKNGKWTKNEIKEKLGRYKKGKTYEEIYGTEKAMKMKMKISEKITGTIKSEESKEKNRKHMIKRLIEGKTINKIGTKPEKEFEKYLINQKIKYQFQYYIEPYLVDFAIPEKKIIYEVYGDYWHTNPKFYNEPKTKAQKFNKIRDKLKVNYLTKKGWKIIIVWEDDIKNNKFPNNMPR